MDTPMTTMSSRLPEKKKLTHKQKITFTKTTFKDALSRTILIITLMNYLPFEQKYVNAL